MLPIRRKLLDGFSTVFPPLQQHARKISAGSSPPPANPQNLAEEYLAWARWLDTLYQNAGNGGEQAARALADGKLGFALRRCLILREKAMLGGSAGHVLLEEAANLAREVEQIVGELTGREMPASDDWPLPYRLYSPQAGQGLLPLPPHGQQERRQQRQNRQNRLSAEEQRDAQLAVGCLALVLQLLHRQPALAESAQWHAANSSLKHSRQMGHLSGDVAPA